MQARLTTTLAIAALLCQGCMTLASDGEGSARPARFVVDLLGGEWLDPHPEWVKTMGTYASYEHSQQGVPGRLVLRIDEPRRTMKWARFLEPTADATRCSELVFQYRAENIWTQYSNFDGVNRSPGGSEEYETRLIANDYIVFLFDGRGAFGGFSPILPSDIVPDGESHEIRVDLAKHEPHGDISEIAIQIFSNDAGKAVLEIEKLQFIGPPQAEAPTEQPADDQPRSLIDEILSNDASARSKAVQSLTERPDREIIDALLDLVATESELRADERAGWALGEIGGSYVVESLIPYLSHERYGTRRGAILALGKIGDARATSALIDVLRGDDDSRARGSAAWALGQIGAADAVAPLIKSLADADAFVGSGAAQALGETGGERSVEALVAALGNPHWRVRCAALAALAKAAAERSVSLAIEALGDDDWHLREKAVVILGQADDPRVEDALTGALQDTSDRVRSKALEVQAARVRSEDRLELVLDALDDESSVVRRKALELVDGSKDPRVVESLVGLLIDDEISLRYRVADALDEAGWEAVTRRERMTYAIARGELDELTGMAISLHASEEEGATVEGPLIFDEPMLIYFRHFMPTRRWPPLIEFRRAEERIEAMMELKCSSVPASYRAEVSLLDDQGNVVATSYDTFESSGVVITYATWERHVTRFSFPLSAEVLDATRFRAAQVWLEDPDLTDKPSPGAAEEQVPPPATGPGR